MNKRQTDIHFKHITAFVVKLFFPLKSPNDWKNVYTVGSLLSVNAS